MTQPAQSTSGSGTGTAVASTAFGSAVVAGNTIVVLIAAAAPPSSVSDSGGNLYTQVVSAPSGNNCIWSATATTGGSNFKVTVHFGASKGVSFTASEISPWSLDQSSAQGGTSNSATPGAVTTLATTEIAFSLAVAVENVPGLPTNWTSLTSGNFYRMCYENFSSIQTNLDPAFSLSSSQVWEAAIVTYAAPISAALPAVPEINWGPPHRHAPWFRHRIPITDPVRRQQILPLPPITTLIAPEIVSGPGVPGSPWGMKKNWIEPVANIVLSQQPTPPPVGLYAPEIRSGPTIPGAPWSLPPAIQIPPGVFGIQKSLPVVGAPKPFITRTPNEDRRTARFTEQVSSLLNSLLAGGYVRLISAQPLTYQVIAGGLTGNGPPGPTTDASMGAIVGCTYVDTLNQKAYVCLSATIGLAQWKVVL